MSLQESPNITLNQTLSLKLPEWLRELKAQAPALDGDIESRVRFVLGLAERNVRLKTGGPFGAAVFAKSSGELISAGVNCVVPEHCSAAHAEIMAISLAQKSLRSFELPSDTQLVVSAQPCIMCLGAILWSGLTEVVYSSPTEDVERIVGFDEGPVPRNWVEEFAKRRIAVIGEVLQSEGARVLELYRSQGGIVYSPRRN